ncbi:lipase family protein [Nocardia sp. NPDC057440]|uniref:lipase family protein n=1 Tax=Nocardia sp. NPDC057440 TaxID=3346134 RepID=UPI00366AF3EB
MSVAADPTAFATRAEHTQFPTPPLLPEVDPFYLPPSMIGQLRPGAVVRAREVELALFGRVAQKISAWQLLYRTCDLDDTPEVAVTTVLLPWGADPAEARPLVSFQCAIDAVASKCLPSYALRRGARAAGAIPQLELPLIAGALARGWAVSVPDHEGTGGQFGAAREPGYRALDGIRAALAFEPLGLGATTPVALWGYSGGGLATAWAAELAGEYAPELDIVGAVAGSPVGDPAAAFVRMNGGLFAGFAAVFTAGLCRAYPELDRLLRSRLDADYLQLMAAAESTTTFPLLYRFARRNLDDHCTGGLAGLLDAPELQRILADIRPGDRAPAMPLLVLQGVYDEVIAVADVDAHVDRYVGAGVHVRYLRDRLSTHILLQFIGAPVIIDWLSDRFGNRALAPNAVETVWSVAFSKRAASGHLRLASLSARMLFGLPIRQRRQANRPSDAHRLPLRLTLRNPLS